jgi:Carboxypeptidase regulatory-like domain
MNLLLLVLLLFGQPGAATRRLSGTVVDAASKTPIFGALVTTVGGKRIGITDKSGKFSSAVKNLPAIRISAPNHATKTVPMTSASTDVDLGRILLWRGGKVTALMPSSIHRDLQWSIGRGDPTSRTIELVREGRWSPGHPELVITDLEPAHYLLTLQGAEPLQKYALPVLVDEGTDLRVPITISPSVMELQVNTGDHPLPDATVKFEHTTLFWKATVQCDARGRASTELWQGGKFWVFTQTSGMIVDGQIREVSATAERVSLSIDLPGHTIHGRVIDDTSGAPIPGVNVALEIASKGARNVVTEPDGSFEFRAVQEGRHTLRAYKRGYKVSRGSRLTVDRDAADQNQTITMVAESSSRVAKVIDSSGAPISGAQAFFGFGADVNLLESSDDGGSVPIPEGTGTLFVVPPSGSFAFRNIAADEREPVIVSVLPARGMLTITSESTKHDPIPYVLFVLRVNGTLLPPAVVGRLAATQNLPFRTDSDGRAILTRLPAGRYDIWPVRSRSDLDRVYAGFAGEPAATVLVSTSPQTVALTFENKSRR